MSVEHLIVQYGEHEIDISLFRRDRKTLEIAVEPDASVSVTAPLDASLNAIEGKVRRRAAWIRRQQRYFLQFLPRTPDRQFIAGETFRYLGRHYRLKVVPHVQAGVKLRGGHLVVQTHRPQNIEATKELVECWYRERARLKFAERLELNVQRFPNPEEFRPCGLIVRTLSQRWGSMSKASRLLLNARLIEAPTDAIDYVITHELCHIAEAHHGPKFVAILDQVLPDWRRRKARLEMAMS
jgi:predicted metal-dependent hydrolase